MKRILRLCVAIGLTLLLSACGKKDAIVKDISEEINNETYSFSKIKNIESLSEYSSDPEVSEKFIQLITALNENNKREGIGELLRTLEKHEYRSPEVAECVANTYWSSNEGISQLIEDERFEGLVSLDYYGPVNGVNRVGRSQIENFTEQMTLMDKVGLWEKLEDNSNLRDWKDMIPFTKEEVSEHTAGMALPEKLKFIEEVPSDLNLPDVITADDVNTYIEKYGHDIYTSSGSGGYYDNRRNQRFKARNREIMGSGDIYTDTAIHYLGDFAVIETEIEYLNSLYEIKHRNEHTMYFRDIRLDIDGDVDIFKYAPPYLFSITKTKTEIFEVDNSSYVRVLYTVE